MRVSDLRVDHVVLVAVNDELHLHEYGDDLEKQSVCTDDQVDQCVKDIKAEACPADKTTSIAVPCKC